MLEGGRGGGRHGGGVGGYAVREEGREFADGGAEAGGVLRGRVDWDVHDFGCLDKALVSVGCLVRVGME